MKFEEVKVPHTLGGASYKLSLYINSAKEVVNHLEVELYKPPTMPGPVAHDTGPVPVDASCASFFFKIFFLPRIFFRTKSGSFNNISNFDF